MSDVPHIEVLTGIPRVGKTQKVIKSIQKNQRCLYLTAKKKALVDFYCRLKKSNPNLIIFPYFAKSHVCTQYNELAKQYNGSELDSKFASMFKEQSKIIDENSVLIEKEFTTTLQDGDFLEFLRLNAKKLNVSEYYLQRKCFEILKENYTNYVVCCTQKCYVYHHSIIGVTYDLLIIDEYRHIIEHAIDIKSGSLHKFDEQERHVREYFTTLYRRIPADIDEADFARIDMLITRIEYATKQTKNYQKVFFDIKRSIITNLISKYKRRKNSKSKFSVLDLLNDIHWFIEGDTDIHLEVSPDYSDFLQLDKGRQKYLLYFHKVMKEKGLQAENRDPFKTAIQNAKRTIAIDATHFPEEYHQFIFGLPCKITYSVIEHKQHFNIITDGNAYSLRSLYKKKDDRQRFLNILLGLNYKAKALYKTPLFYVARSKREKEVLTYHLQSFDKSLEIDYYSSDKSESVSSPNPLLTVCGIRRLPSHAQFWRELYLMAHGIFSLRDFTSYLSMTETVQYVFRSYSDKTERGTIMLNTKHPKSPELSKETLDYQLYFWKAFNKLRWTNDKVRIKPIDGSRRNKDFNIWILWATEELTKTIHKNSLMRDTSIRILFHIDKSSSKRLSTKQIKKALRTENGIRDKLVTDTLGVLVENGILEKISLKKGKTKPTLYYRRKR